MSFTYMRIRVYTYIHSRICHAENSQRLKVKSSIFAKSPNLDVRQGFEYASALLSYWRTLRSETIFDIGKSSKNDEKCFLFHLKSSFRSQDI